MGQFKPMVKMMTDEPSVILKLKKGGHVASKKDAKAEHGHKPMSGLETRPTSDFMGAEDGDAPKKPSMAERRKAMNPNQYKGGGKAKPTAIEVEVDLKRHASKPASAAHDGLKKGGKVQKKADGGRIDEFVKGKVVSADRHDSAKGTGEVGNGKPGGYKRGGKIHKKADGGTIEGNADKFVNKIVDGDKHDPARGTGGVTLGDGGYKRGGRAKKYAKGGSAKEPGVGNAIEGNEDKFTNDNVTDGDRYDSARGTGEVKLGAGGYKKGGKAKKAYATGGNVVDDGKAVKMPHHFLSQPVANTMQSGTFRKGGKVPKLAAGGLPPAVGNVPAPQGQADLATYYDMLAHQQDMQNNAGYAAATQSPRLQQAARAIESDPGLLQRIKNALMGGQ